MTEVVLYLKLKLTSRDISNMDRNDFVSSVIPKRGNKMYKKVVVVTNKVPVLEKSSPTKLTLFIIILYSFEYFSFGGNSSCH